MKKILKLCSKLLICVGVSILFLNCEDNYNDYQEIKHEEKSKYKIFDKSFSDLVKNSKFKDGYSNIRRNYLDNTKDKNMKEQNYNFTIDSSKIKEISADNYTSYTFLIYRDTIDENYFENLVIEIDSSNNTNAYLIRYNLNSQVIESQIHDSYKIDSNIDIQMINHANTEVNNTANKISAICFELTNIMCNWSEGNVPGPEHIATDNCTDAFTYESTGTYCVDLSSSGGSGGYPPPVPPSGGSGNPHYPGGGGDGGNPYNPITVPLPDCGNNRCVTIEEQIIGNFIDSLTLEQQNWYNSLISASLQNEIDNFLIDNIENGIVNSQAASFIEEAIKAKINNGDIDLPNRLIYNPLEAQNYRNRMSPAEIEIFDNLNILQKEGYLRAATQAYIYSETHFPNPVRNRLGDAFKHTFWNALSTIYIGEELTLQLTTAHEEIDYDPDYPNHYKEKQMDLYNNSKGRQVAYGAGRLYELVNEGMNNGELRYLDNLVYINGFWNASETSNLIPTNQ
jgi:hypothetical protein